MTSGVSHSVSSPEGAEQSVGGPTIHFAAESNSCVNQGGNINPAIPPRPQPEDNGRSEGSRDSANSGGGDKGSYGARFINHYSGTGISSIYQFLINISCLVYVGHPSTLNDWAVSSSHETNSITQGMPKNVESWPNCSYCARSHHFCGNGSKSGWGQSCMCMIMPPPRLENVHLINTPCVDPNTLIMFQKTGYRVWDFWLHRNHIVCRVYFLCLSKHLTTKCVGGELQV